MAGSVEFSCQVLNGTNKAGSLKKNDKGYYEMIVGALNMTNNKGEFYDYNSARKFFDEASDMVRMAEKGVLRGEYGHPKQVVGMSDDAFVERLLTVEEKSTCCHHRRIYLDFDRFKDPAGRPIIGIMSEIMPSGPYADSLQRSFENPNEDTCFSIRCFSLPRRGPGGRIIKEMRHVVTFDYVHEPGILMATKYHTPTLEDYHARTFSQGTVQRVARTIEARPGSNESSIIPVRSLMDAMGWETPTSAAGKRNFFELMKTAR